MKNLIMKQSSQTISLLKKCRCTSGLHLEAERVRNKMNFFSRMCIGVKGRNKKWGSQDPVSGRNPSQENTLLCKDLSPHLGVSSPDRGLGSRPQLLPTMPHPGPDRLARRALSFPISAIVYCKQLLCL